ncbi:MAG: S46 family peptidase [Bacteroidetes bacterium]|nr:S46 family peptidase [Bacteroidota bacterium]
MKLFQARGYDSRDAVNNKHYTTLKGIMEKDNPEVYDYDVPQRLHDLYASRDIRYALFIIDKFAGAGYLLNEMVIIDK